MLVCPCFRFCCYRPGSDPEVTLNPPPETLLKAGDCLVVLAEDDDTYAPNDSPFVVTDRRIAPTAPVWSLELSRLEHAHLHTFCLNGC